MTPPDRRAKILEALEHGPLDFAGILKKTAIERNVLMGDLAMLRGAGRVVVLPDRQHFKNTYRLA